MDVDGSRGRGTPGRIDGKLVTESRAMMGLPGLIEAKVVEVAKLSTELRRLLVDKESRSGLAW